MGLDIAKGMQLSGIPVAWMHLLDPASGEDTVWRFTNLQSCKATVKIPGSAESGAENIDVTRNDDAIIRFPKANLVIDGRDESDITPATSVATASNKATMELIVNQAPLEKVTMTKWFEKLQEYINRYFLITFPTGMSYYGRSQATPIVDGYVKMIGKITNDLDLAGGNTPAAITLQFASNEAPSGVDAADIEALTYTAIKWEKGLGGSNQTFSPSAWVSGDGDILVAGDLLIIPAAIT